jgi:hypothetical protein
VFTACGARHVALPLKKIAKSIPGSWTNMLALGLAGALAGIPAAALEAALRASWKRGETQLQANLAALQRGLDEAAQLAECGMARLPEGCGRRHAALADQRQRGGRLRRAARRRALRRRLPDHAGHRAAGVDGAGADAGRRHAAAGRGRAGLGQHDHRRVVRRRAVAHRHRRAGAWR